MYDINNWKSEMDAYLGADDPKYVNREAFSVGEIADLYYDFQPCPSDEVYLEERKIEYYGKINELKTRLMESIATKSFDTSGIGEVDGITLMNRQAISEFFTSIGGQCPKVFMPHANSKSLPPYLNPDHENYCPELALAIEICESIYVRKEGNPSQSITKRIESLLSKQYLALDGGNLPVNFDDRMKALCNNKKINYKKSLR